MFVRFQGKTKMMSLPVTPSTAFAAGSLVAFSSGKLVPATNTVDSFSIVGVIRHTISSTDSDYASDRLVEVEVPVEKNVVWKADVKVGTLVATSVGLYFDLTTADDGSGVDQTASSLDICWCVGYISASQGLFILNIGADGKVKA